MICYQNDPCEIIWKHSVQPNTLHKRVDTRDVNKDLTPKNQDKDKDLTHKDQDKKKDPTPKDKNKEELTPKDQDKDHG